MRPVFDPTGGPDVLVEKMIGTAYETVKRVYHHLPEIRRLDGVLAEIPTLAQTTVDNALAEAMPPIREELAQAVQLSVNWAEGVQPDPTDPSRLSSKGWAEQAEDSAEAAAESALAATKVNMMFPFTSSVSQMIYDVTVISGQTDVNTVGMALWVEGAIEFDFTILSATTFMLNDATAYPENAQMRVILNAHFNDLVHGFDQLLGALEQEYKDAASLNGRWCGVHVVPPTTRLDGSPFQEADEYQNRSDKLRYSWNGSTWVALNSSAQSLEAALAAPTGTQKLSYLNPATGAVSIQLFEKLAAMTRNVEEFRLGPDADDTASFQRAADWASSLAGSPAYRSIGILCNPTKTYILDVNALMLKPGAVFIGSLGEYPGATLLLKRNNGFGIDTADTAVNFAGMVGFKIQGAAGVVNNGGIRLKLGHECVFANLNFLDFQNQGFVIGGGAANVVSRLFSDRCVMNRVRTAPMAAIELFGTDFQISDVEAGCGITADQGRTSADLYVRALWIGGSAHFVDKCVGGFADVGMYITCSTSMLTNNRSDFSQGPGWIWEGGGQNRGSINIALSNSQHQDGLYPGHHFVGSSSKGNKLDMLRSVSLTPKRHSYGILDETTGTGAGPNEYTLADSSGQVNGKFFLVAGSSSIFHYPKSGQPRPIQVDVAVPNVANYGMFLSTNTVPVTYTDFSGGEPGQPITILAGNANCRIANNAVVLTRTGNTLALTTNDFASFVKDGAVWRQCG